MGKSSKNKGKGGTQRHIQFYGYDEILTALMLSKEKLTKAVAESIKESIQIPKQDMLDFMSKHKYSGKTYESWKESVEANGTVVSVDFGFSIKDGGLPAIFLNLGGLRNPPYYFIDNAINHNLDRIKNKQIETLKEVFKECGIN